MSQLQSEQNPAARQAMSERPPFARLLRHWRNARKLSQLDLALVSDISQRHLSFLELGRAQPSRDMVLRLGEALELPLRGQNALLGAAGFAPKFRESALQSPDMEPVFGALRLMLRHHEPNPAVVVDRCWNLLLVNDAMQRVLSLMGDPEAIWQTVCGDGPRNLFKLLFHPQGTRAAVLNFDLVGPVMIARTRREAEALQNQALLDLLDEVQRYEGMEEIWSRAAPEFDDNQPVIPLELSAHGQKLSLFSVISTFGTPSDITTDEIRVESFFPADHASAEFLNLLAAQQAGLGQDSH